MSMNCPSAAYKQSEAPSSLSLHLLQERWESSPKDDRHRLELCWGYNDCGDCHRSDGFCGWCPLSQTCLPLPTDAISRAFPLLAPLRYKFICATGPERFELRTSGLGCQVSTITFLTSIVTIFCTLLGLVILYWIFELISYLNFAMRARRGGWVVYGNGREEVWSRKGENWRRWWRRMRGQIRDDETEELDNGTWERSWRFWNGAPKHHPIRSNGSETQPLL
ncbi:unnamed protein product [Periconia digitata]|uniref:PSI domain-containing protein n=1 Tax=Periconia digitata TaxID=1303443 RepID=A0A9W4U658_9PLEO|nr:unnamed protein product [Periconia digitata]